MGISTYDLPQVFLLKPIKLYASNPPFRALAYELVSAKSLAQRNVADGYSNLRKVSKFAHRNHMQSYGSAHSLSLAINWADFGRIILINLIVLTLKTYFSSCKS